LAYPLLSFIPALLNVAILIYIFYYQPKGRTTDIFSFFVIALITWQIEDTILRITVQEETARLWDKLLCIGWIGVGPLVFHFACRYAGLRKLHSRGALIATYLPFIVLYLIYISNPDLLILNRHETWGWVVTPRPGSTDGPQRYYISLVVLCAVFIIFRHAYLLRNNRQKRTQAMLVAFGIMIPALQGILTQVVFPLILSKEEIPVTSTFLTFFSVATIIALSRFRLFNISESVELNTVLGNLSNIVIIASVDEKVLYMNPHARKVFGGRENEVKPLSDLFPALSYKSFREEVLHYCLTGERSRNYTTTLSARGKQLEVIMFCEPVVNNKRIQGILLVANDITEKLKTLKQLKESNERYNLVSKATNDMVWDWDLSTGKVYRNQEGWKKIFQRPLGTDMGTEQDWEAMVHPDDLENLRKAKNQIASSKGNDFFEIECRIRKEDGSYGWILDRGYVVRNDDGTATRLIGATQDTTAKKRAELSLKEEQMRKQKEITDAVIIAQENERKKIGAELHDNVNQILACSLLYLNMAKKEGEDMKYLHSKTDEMVKKAINEIRKLSHELIPPSLAGENLADALRKLVEPAETTGLAFTSDVERVDEESIPEKLKLTIYRIVQEQLNNILKYSRAGHVFLELAQTNGELILRIKDDGIGFDTTKKAKGVGLLNITTRAELHNGVVQILSEPGHGCLLIVSFPLLKELNMPLSELEGKKGEVA
jgi:two-component system sensor histidine kinase UhpB